MSVFSALKTAEPFLIGVGVPVLMGSLALTVPVQFAQQGTLAKIETKIDQMHEDVGKIASDVGKLSERMGQSEADPSKLLAKVVGGSANDMNIASFAFINDKLVALPKNDKAKSRFIAAGYSLESVTPTISGFVLNIRTSDATSGSAGARVP